MTKQDKETLKELFDAEKKSKEKYEMLTKKQDKKHFWLFNVIIIFSCLSMLSLRLNYGIVLKVVFFVLFIIPSLIIVFDVWFKQIPYNNVWLEYLSRKKIA